MGKDFDSLLGFILLMVGAAAVGKIINDATKKSPYKCSRCGAEIFQNENPCHSCGASIRW